MSRSDDECSAAPLHTNDDVAAALNIEQHTSSRAVNVVLELQPNDVKVGRGARINAHQGNVHFRQVIQQWKHAYQMAITKGRKQEIASLVVAHVKNEQGRFLRPIVHSSDEADELQIPDGVNAWVEVEYSKAIEKAKQALRERGHAVVRGDQRCRLTDSLNDFGVGIAASADGGAAVDVSTFGTGETSSFAAPPPLPPPPQVSMAPQNFMERTLRSAPSRESSTFPFGTFHEQTAATVQQLVGNGDAHLLQMLRENHGTGTLFSDAAAPTSFTMVPPSYAPPSSVLRLRLQEEIQRELLQQELQSRMALLQQMEQEAALQRQRQLQLSLLHSISSQSSSLPLATLSTTTTTTTTTTNTATTNTSTPSGEFTPSANHDARAAIAALLVVTHAIGPYIAGHCHFATSGGSRRNVAAGSYHGENCCSCLTPRRLGVRSSTDWQPCHR